MYLFGDIYIFPHDILFGAHSITYYQVLKLHKLYMYIYLSIKHIQGFSQTLIHWHLVALLL